MGPVLLGDAPSFRIGRMMANGLLLGLLSLVLAACVESKTYQPPPPPDPTVPTVPTPRLPQNDAYEDSSVLNRLQPTFVWEASTVAVGELTHYEVQYSADKAFATGVVTAQVATTSHRPAEALEVSTVPPVGRRYYWRVRACNGELCSEYSRRWWVNVGRSMKDFNGDGYDDVVVGAFAPPASQHENGKVYVYFGGTGASFDATPDITTYDLEVASWIGFSVSSAGDFNGDGFADVLIGAPLRDVSGEVDRGVAYLLFGGVAMDNVADVYFNSDAPGEKLGMSVSSAGDVNADGYTDVVVGAPGRSGNERAFIYWGMANPPADAIARAALLVPSVGRYGSQVSNAGDLNGDGYADVVIGIDNGYQLDVNEICSSEVYLGGEMFDGASDGKISGPAGEKCSLRTTDAGDVNADGFSDLVARSTMRSEGLRLFLGGKELPKTPDVVFALSNDRRCREAASVGDVNGDGADDLAMVEYTSSTDTNVHIYLGKVGARERALFETPAATIAGTASLFGWAVAATGDLNGDGYDDFVVGQHNSDDTVGRAFVFFGNGGASLNAISDGTLTDGGLWGFFGMSVAAAKTTTSEHGAASSNRWSMASSPRTRSMSSWW